MSKSGLIERIRCAINFVIYGKGKCRIMTCGKCGKILIYPISDEITTKIMDDKRHIDLLWSQVDKCKICGAVCEEIQLWNFEGDPLKIDPTLEVKGE
jgi:hypothetical protein